MQNPEDIRDIAVGIDKVFVLYAKRSQFVGGSPSRFTFSPQQIKIFNHDGSESGSFTIETNIPDSDTYQILAHAISATDTNVYIGFSRWWDYIDGVRSHVQFGSANTLWAYSLTGERKEEDDITLPLSFGGSLPYFGILSLDWDATNDKLWALIEQKTRAQRGAALITGSTRKLGTIDIDSVVDVTWSAIPQQTMLRGQTLDLNLFISHSTNIIFGEDYRPVSWLTLSNGILSVASTGVPSGLTNLIIPLVGIGRSDPAFTTLQTHLSLIHI